MILFAYPYWTEEAQNVARDLRSGGVVITLDSGAFTAHKGGAPIVFEEYQEAFRAAVRGDLISRGIQLDVVGDAAGTERNLKRHLRELSSHELESLVPVLTPSGDADSLKAACDGWDPEWVAVAGFTSVRDLRWVRQRVREVRAAFGEQVLVHALGCSSLGALATEADGFDSSSFSAAARFGSRPPPGRLHASGNIFASGRGMLGNASMEAMRRACRQQAEWARRGRLLSLAVAFVPLGWTVMALWAYVGEPETRSMARVREASIPDLVARLATSDRRSELGVLFGERCHH